jgi:Zn-dependent peptidase ImmA (M78 family)
MPGRRALEDLSEKVSLTDYARLKATWGISMQALIMRAFAVGRIGETRRRSLFVQLSAHGWRKQEPVTVGKEEPRLLWTLLSRRFGAKPYRHAAEDLAIPPAVLRSIAPTPIRATGTVPGSPEMGGKVVQFRR